MAPMNEATYEVLLERHPPPHPDAFIPPIEEAGQHHSVTVEEVLQAIRSFPKASAGGPDGLRPQHLKDMMSDNGSRQVLLPTLASFVQLVLEGRTQTSIRRIFFGTNLTALLKKQGGVRPIAVGSSALLPR